MITNISYRVAGVALLLLLEVWLGAWTAQPQPLQAATLPAPHVTAHAPFQQDATQATPALAGTAQFAPVGFQVQGSYHGNIFTSLVHAGQLYVGGNFLRANGVNASRIARWDGASWYTLGSGIHYNNFGADYAMVMALATLGSDLYAGGYFTDAGGVPANHIARWDGTTWHRLGAGITGDAGSSAVVNALAVIDNNLFVAGRFSYADGLATANIARWDGKRWHALGSGVNGEVKTLAVVQGKLMVGGIFGMAGGSAAERVASWDGTTWQTLGSGLSAGGGTALASTMVISGTDLVVGGVFNNAGGSAALNVARWDGSTWHALDAGLAGYGVHALGLHQQHLYAATTPHPMSHLTQLQRWDGITWQQVGDNLHELISTLSSFGDELIAGGSIEYIGERYVGGLAGWNGSNWHPIGSGSGLNGLINTILVHGSDVYVGGSFSAAGERLVNNIARWDGTTWHALGSGVDGDVFALAFMGDELVASGRFQHAGGQLVNYIARWDGTSWANLSVGADSSIEALVVQGTTLFAGGSFRTIGGVAAAFVARWDGSEWSALGNGLNSFVTALAIHDQQLIAAGYFQKSGDRPVVGTAFWDGNAWQQVGNGTSPYSGQLASFKGALYRSNFYSRQLARWDGTTWANLDPAVPDDAMLDRITAISADANALYIGLTDGLQVINGSSIARYDGTNWQALTMKLDGATNSLGVAGQNLLVGGAFLEANRTPSGNLAIWNADMQIPPLLIPWIQR